MPVAVAEGVSLAAPAPASAAMSVSVSSSVCVLCAFVCLCVRLCPCPCLRPSACPCPSICLLPFPAHVSATQHAQQVGFLQVQRRRTDAPLRQRAPLSGALACCSVTNCTIGHFTFHMLARHSKKIKSRHTTAEGTDCGVYNARRGHKCKLCCAACCSDEEFS